MTAETGADKAHEAVEALVRSRMGFVFDPLETPRRSGPKRPRDLLARAPIRSPGEMPAPRSLGDDPMFFYMAIYCMAIRLIFFYSLVRAQIKSDTVKDHWLFLGVLYTAATGFLNYVFILSWKPIPWANWQVRVAQNFGVTPWQAYIVMAFLLYTLYFWLMAKFDEGVIFWTLLLLGLPLVFFTGANPAYGL